MDNGAYVGSLKLTAVRWEELGSAKYEMMVSVLISRIYPRARRIDGSGGDGGRDVRVPVYGGHATYELKSFTGRMGSTQRAQVKRSLTRAATHNPVAWYLVVPIDHTPAELTWFEKLTRDYPFPCDWLGRTWLDSEMALRPDIKRYFIDGADNEVVRKLTELAKEQAAFAGGVPDAMERLKALMASLNEIDPFYTFALSVDPERITIIPRYVDAERDRPITVTTRFADTPEGQAAATAFEEALDYGTPATVVLAEVDIDAPAGLGHRYEGAVLELLGSTHPTMPAPRAALRVLDHHGRPVVELPLASTQAPRVGRQGGEWLYQDQAGALTVTIRFNRTSGQVNLTCRYSTPDGILPGILLPTVRLMAALEPGRAVEIVLNGTNTIRETINEPRPGGPAGFARTLASLDFVQRETGIYFPLPTLSHEDINDIRQAEMLLRGQTVTGTWNTMTVRTTVGGLPARRASGLGEVPIAISQEADCSMSIAGHSVHIGRISQRLAQACLPDWPHIPDDDTEVDLELIPGPDNSVVTRLLPTIDDSFVTTVQST